MIGFLMRPVWWLATWAAILTGAAWGYLPTGADWLGRHHATSDIAVSAGGYATSGIVLLLASVAIESLNGPRNARHLTFLFAATYTFLALRAALDMHAAPISAATGWDAFAHGAHGVAMTPWSWLFIVTGAWGWVSQVLHRASVAPSQTSIAGIDRRTLHHASVAQTRPAPGSR